jgi:hypothetical protein
MTCPLHILATLAVGIAWIAVDMLEWLGSLQALDQLLKTCQSVRDISMLQEAMRYGRREECLL